MSPNRLRGYDYASAGAYFVTISTYCHQKILSRIEDEAIILKPPGVIADICWQDIPKHFAFTELGIYRIMPDHIHGILMFSQHKRHRVRAKHALPYPQDSIPGSKPDSLSAVIQSYKSAVTRKIHGRNLINGQVWDKGFHDRVIRDEAEMKRIHAYIEMNPSRCIQ